MARIIRQEEALREAAALLGAGGVVAIPTETVYGLAADAFNGEAVAKIFETKGRPRFNPLIAHVSNIGMATELAVFNDRARALAEKFWPGPLTMVLPMTATSPVHPLVTAGLDTLAIRVPQNTFTRALIAELDHPLAAPSANRSGRISATTAAAVDAELGDRIELIVDGGSAQVGVESTIVKVDDDRVTLLRPGGVAREAIEDVVKTRLEAVTGATVQAPGMLLSHYAPQLPVRLGAREVNSGEALLAFGPRRAQGSGQAAATVNLSEAGDLREAAANLFSAMRELDRAQATAIAVEPIPEEGLGEAINDRLRRAAAPRDMTGQGE
ncbi:L-threonylcarbamoyladenylate synthase [Mesorhizobium sp. Z1-4]|uniref:L-threonylcarbamoyladenylate synthase n=1 Tax=Mesorhizobium sp. Z1-4 TaxID=2448478 RepID=UPI000FD94B67|nr:L-threonylcarbamoyladenylate synthase [Mesorhizobium sp. Z1-4]